jgi:hypothetical protein
MIFILLILVQIYLNGNKYSAKNRDNSKLGEITYEILIINTFYHSFKAILPESISSQHLSFLF